MRKVVLKMHVSLDGFVGAPDGNVGFMVDHRDDELEEWEVALLWTAGAHAMGRNLYGDMAAFWPSSEEVYAPPMNTIPKVVFSETLEEAEWGPTRIERRPLPEAIAAMRSEDGNDVLVHGGAGLARSLSRAGLIDTYHLVVHPIALGEGLPIFDTEVTLRLIEARRFPRGASSTPTSPLPDPATCDLCHRLGGIVPAPRTLDPPWPSLCPKLWRKTEFQIPPATVIRKWNRDATRGSCSRGRG